MKLKLYKLTPRDKAVLADFYESEAYKIFKKHFIDNGQIILGQQAITAADFNQVNKLNGAATQLGNIDDTLRDIHKKNSADRD